MGDCNEKAKIQCFCCSIPYCSKECQQDAWPLHEPFCHSNYLERLKAWMDYVKDIPPLEKFTHVPSVLCKVVSNHCIHTIESPHRPFPIFDHKSLYGHSSLPQPKLCIYCGNDAIDLKETFPGLYRMSICSSCIYETYCSSCNIPHLVNNFCIFPRRFIIFILCCKKRRFRLPKDILKIIYSKIK
jgi:hypothetical protein